MSFTIEKALQRINGEIALLELGEQPSELYVPLHYILGLGGKRLRPMLTLLACSLYSDDYEKALRPAIGVEVFHNFSLIHDDIMDQARLRRGKQTVHEKWDTPTAILSGDVALVEAYKLIFEVEDVLKAKAFTLFSQTAKEVCEGQQWDMLFEKRERVSVAEYVDMIRLKTAVLLGFSLQLGALIGGASEEEANKLRLFGEDIGLAFQIKDDYLDTYGEGEKVGKQIGGDILAGKKTYLYVKALELADDKTTAALHKAYITADPAKKVAHVKAIFDQLELAKATEQAIEELYARAIKRLSGLTPGIFKTAKLKQFADGLMQRVS